jgi:hypothetical protein
VGDGDPSFWKKGEAAFGSKLLDPSFWNQLLDPSFWNQLLDPSFWNQHKPREEASFWTQHRVQGASGPSSRSAGTPSSAGFCEAKASQLWIMRSQAGTRLALLASFG